jgi:hypothetical protein
MNIKTEKKNDRKITARSAWKRHWNDLNWEENLEFTKWKIWIKQNHSSDRDWFWTKFSWLFVTNVVKIWITKNIISTIISISRIIISRSITWRTITSVRKITSTIINETLISRIVNSKKFSQTIIFIFISIRNSTNFFIKNFTNTAKSLYSSIFIIRKFLHSSFIIRKEVNAQTIISISFFEIWSIIWIIWAIL